MGDHNVPMNRNKRRFYTKVFVVSAFLIVLSSLILTSFYDVFSLTGSIINEIDLNNTAGEIKIDAVLTIPDAEVKGKFEKVDVKGGSDSNFYVENEKFYLGISQSNYITLKNYDGTIFFDSSKISELKGKASNVSMNGVSVSPESKSTLKIRLDEDFIYSSLAINNGVYLEELNYNATGTVKINDGKNVFNLNNDGITIKNFQGILVH